MAKLFGTGKKPKGRYQELGQGASDSDEFSLSDDEKVLFKKSGEIELNLCPETRIKRVKRERSRCQYVLICGSILVILISLVVVGIVYARSHGMKPFSKPKLTNSKSSQLEPSGENATVKGSGDWTVSYKNMAGEGSVRLLDIDGDGVDDIIFASAKASNNPLFNDDEVKKFEGLHKNCDSKGLTYPCMGNVIALNGHDGTELWSMKTSSEIFEMNCEDFDVNKDGKKDCIATGRTGQMAAFDPYKGETLWTCEDDEVFHANWNTYHAAPLPDWDGDGVPEVLIANGGDPTKEPDDHDREPGRLAVLSGATGRPVSKRYLEMPNRKETYMSPVMFTPAEDRATYILFGSGGETVPGDLMGISVGDFCHYILGDSAEVCGQNSAKQYTDIVKDENGIFIIYKGKKKGVMVPPVIVDYDGDGIRDILMTSFEGVNNLYCGSDLHLIWTANFSGMETYGTPAPGYFNDDVYVDFMVTWNHGEWMTYDSINVYVISGKDGSILWTLKSGFIQMSSSLSIATTLAHHDVFLFKVQGRDSKFKMTQDGLVRLNNTVERRKCHGSDLSDSQKPPAEFRKMRFYSHLNCDDDLSTYKGEVFVIDRNSVQNPVRVLNIPTKKHTYDANPKCSKKPSNSNTIPLNHGDPRNRIEPDDPFDKDNDDGNTLHPGDMEGMADSSNKNKNSENSPDDNIIGDNRTDNKKPSAIKSNNGTIDADSMDENTGREGSGNPGNRPKREDTEEKKKMCSVEEPDRMSSGIIGEVDGDDNLDYVSVTSTFTMLYDAEYCKQGMAAELTVQKISLEKGLLDGSFHQIPVKAETSMKQSGINDPALKEKTFLPMSRQRWTQYFGTKDDNVYR